MTLSCHDATLSLGSYLVGALDPQERADVDSHLAGCPACRDELASLAALPGLLSRLTLDEALAGPPPVDDAMLERLLTAVAAERRVARHRRWLAAAAAAVVLVGGVVGGTAAWHAAHTEHMRTVSAASGPIHMRAELSSAANGTAVTMSLSGVPADEKCRLIAVSDTGTREVAGSWEATYGGTAQIRSMTWIPYRHLHQLVIETFDGRQLVTATVS